MNKQRLVVWMLLALSPTLSGTGCSSSGNGAPPDASESRICATEKRVAGVDISDNNGNSGQVDWGQLRRADNFFVISKAYEDGVANYASFPGQWSSAAINGFIRGAYYFFNISKYTDNNALEFSRLLGKLGPGDLPAMLDLDTPELAVGQHTKEYAIQTIQSWLTIVERETGKRPIIYTSPNTWNALGNPTSFSSYFLWLSNWTHDPNSCPSIAKGWNDWAFWQYSNMGSIPGAGNSNGYTDLDLYRGTYEDLQLFAGCTPADAARVAACAPASPCQTKVDGKYCGGTVAGYLGASTDLVSCGGGVVVNAAPCSFGCTVQTTGMGDTCVPPPAGTAPSCTDKIKNGNETSLDCGGGSCPGCADGLHCLVNTDCLNGYCASNVCISAPQILVDSLSNPFDLTLDANNIYWVENRVSGGALRKVLKSGGSTITLSASLAEPTAVVVDASYAYVLERNGGTNGMIHRIPVNGGTPELVVSGLNGATSHLIQWGNNLYWGDYVLGTGAVIKTASKGASVASSIVAQGNGLLNLQTVSALDTDGTYLYVRNDYYQMLRFPIGGGSPSVLGPAGAASFLSAIRVLAGTVYFSSPDEYRIGSIPAAGGAMSTLAMEGNGFGDLAVDSGYVYFIDPTSPLGNVRRVSNSGGQLKTYYPQAGSIGIEVDSTHVYWITNVMANQGKVMRAPK